MRKRVYHNPDITKRLYFTEEMKEDLMAVKRLEDGDKILLRGWEEVDQYLRYDESGELPRLQRIPIFVIIIKAKGTPIKVSPRKKFALLWYTKTCCQYLSEVNSSNEFRFFQYLLPPLLNAHELFPRLDVVQNLPGAPLPRY